MVIMITDHNSITLYSNITGGKAHEQETDLHCNKRQKCLLKHRTHYELENRSLGFIETFHKQ